VSFAFFLPSVFFLLFLPLYLFLNVSNIIDTFREAHLEREKVLGEEERQERGGCRAEG
jgi:hypothetical protein